MRTTINLEDQAYELAKSYARDQSVSLGEAISQLILDRHTKHRIETNETGLPTIAIGKVLTQEMVRELLDDE